jgi:AraC-like DNA-binding protein
MAGGTVIMPIHYFLKTSSLLAYFIAQLFLFKKYKFNKLQKNTTNQYQVTWFILYFGSQFILTTTSLIDHFSGLHISDDPYEFIVKMIAFFLYCIMIGLLFFPSILYGNSVVVQEIKEKYSHSKLINTEKEAIINDLNRFMQAKNKPYLNEKIAMAEIAKILGVSSQKISQVINEKTNYNFNDYVNTFRIEEAKKILLSATYSKMTIDAIAKKSGFHSKSAFYVAFKKHTGNTPKEFVLVSESSIGIKLEQSVVDYNVGLK